MRTLKVISGPSEGHSLELEDEIVIGRAGADLSIDDPELSRRHAAVRPIEGGIEAEDLGSTNGTFVNGSRIEAATAITEDGTIRVGVTEIAVELALPSPEPDDAPIAAPEVTVARQVLNEPDVTAPRKIPQDLPEPDVTAPRKIPQGPPEPDVTAPRKVLNEPDVTAPRRIPDAGPPAEAAPPEPAPPQPKGGGTPAPVIVMGAIIAVLLVVIVILLLA